VQRWRRIIPLVGSLVRFWGDDHDKDDDDKSVDLAAIPWLVRESHLRP